MECLKNPIILSSLILRLFTKNDSHSSVLKNKEAQSLYLSSYAGWPRGIQISANLVSSVFLTSLSPYNATMKAPAVAKLAIISA
jgi:hypothetical protein